MSRKLCFVLVALSLAATFVVPAALASPESGKQRMKKHRGDGDRWLAKLNLTEDQQEEIDGIKKKLQPEFDKRRSELQEKRTEVNTAREKLNQAFKTDAKERELKKLFKRLQRAKDDMSAAKKGVAEVHFDKLLAIRETLSPEQRQQMDAFSKRRKWRKEKRSGRKHRGARKQTTTTTTNSATGVPLDAIIKDKFKDQLPQ